MELKHYRTLIKLSASLDPKTVAWLMSLIEEGEAVQQMRATPPAVSLSNIAGIRNLYWRTTGIADLLEAIAADLK